MIQKAKHNFIIYPFFKRYAGWIMKRHFGEIKILGEFQDKKLPVLLISNHISWWDGFWSMYLNVKVLRRKFHFMMLEEQLRKFWFFNYTGGYSVNKKSKSIIETLNYTNDLLTNPGNMVLIYPQGEITSMHQQYFIFEKGMERILKNKNNVQLIFQVNMIDYFSAKSPGIYIYIRDFSDTVTDNSNLQENYNTFYKQCIDNQNKLRQSL